MFSAVACASILTIPTRQSGPAFSSIFLYMSSNAWIPRRRRTGTPGRILGGRVVEVFIVEESATTMLRVRERDKLAFSLLSLLTKPTLPLILLLVPEKMMMLRSEPCMASTVEILILRRCLLWYMSGIRVRRMVLMWSH